MGVELYEVCVTVTNDILPTLFCCGDRVERRKRPRLTRQEGKGARVVSPIRGGVVSPDGRELEGVGIKNGIKCEYTDEHVNGPTTVEGFTRQVRFPSLDTTQPSLTPTFTPN